MDWWFEGIALLGRFGPQQVGCWLLAHGRTCAVLELPPAAADEVSPAVHALRAARETSLTVRYLLCTHAHSDHFSERTLHDMWAAFPFATLCLQAGFRRLVDGGNSLRCFDSELRLDLDGEPLVLVHAPKHSASDTMVVFRGTVCTGAWELGTLRSIHDGGPLAVANPVKLAAVSRMERFEQDHDYRVHQLFSVHGTDRREGVDLPGLMRQTRTGRGPV